MPPLTRRRTGSSKRVRYYESASDQSDDSSQAQRNPRKTTRKTTKGGLSDSDFDAKSDSSQSSVSSSSASVASEVNVENEASEGTNEEILDSFQTVKWITRPKLRLFPKDMLSAPDDEILEDFRSCMPNREVEELKSRLPLGPERSNFILHELGKKGSHFVGMYLRSSWWGYRKEVTKDFLSRLQAAALNF
jgi:hypothetical protein